MHRNLSFLQEHKDVKTLSDINCGGVRNIIPVSNIRNSCVEKICYSKKTIIFLNFVSNGDITFRNDRSRRFFYVLPTVSLSATSLEIVSSVSQLRFNSFSRIKIIIINRICIGRNVIFITRLNIQIQCGFCIEL